MKIIKQARVLLEMRVRPNLKRYTTVLVSLAALLIAGGSAIAADRVLEDISFASLSGDRVQITLTTDGTMPQPLSFTIDNPARIAIDLVDTTSQLKTKSLPINIGVAKSVTTVEAGGRTRIVLNLVEMVAYDLDVQGNDVVITLGGRGDSNALIASSSTRHTAVAAAEVTNVDFRRGAAGEGIVIVEVSDPAVTFDVREEGGKIIVDFIDVVLPQRLAQRLDVVDFSTAVQTIDTTSIGNNVRMVIAAKGFYEHLAYQSDKVFSVQVTEVSSQAKKEELQKERFGYTGKRLSLNFQDVPVRAVLQLIADFTDLNMVASDTVDGSITLRLRNVPWDQALDIILKTKGLDKRQSGNVILVGPADEILAREQQELESKQQIAELAPLRSELIQVNYAKASDIAALLAGGSSLLSERGAVTVDERTNSMLVNDTADKLEEIRKLLLSLDIPIRQVLIEARIVIANDDFSKDLGARFGITANVGGSINSGNGGGLITGGGASNAFDTLSVDNDAGGIIVGDTLNSNLGVPGSFGSIGFSLTRLPLGALIDLELTAMQSEERGEIISTPRVITANQTEALIEQGVEIPFQEATSSGATSISFKKAVLSLTVTPQITPDDRVIMDLNVKNDSVGEIFFGVPSIDTREVQTQVLVNNGETIVLGGVFQESTRVGKDKVPFFGDLPVVGRLFRRDSSENDKEELLIFITPKILKDGLHAR